MADEKDKSSPAGETTDKEKVKSAADKTAADNADTGGTAAVKETPDKTAADTAAPEKGKAKAKTSKPFRVVASVLAALIILSATFFAGYRVRERQLNAETRTLDWVISQIKRNYYEDVTSEEIVSALSYGLQQKLFDPYSGYYSAKDYAEIKKSMQGIKLGIGVSFYNEEKARIYRVVGGSPADQAGFLKNEVITGVRLTSAGGAFTKCETLAAFTSALAALPENEDIDFLVQSGEKEIVRTAQKAEYTQKTVLYFNSEDFPSLPQDAAYIRLDTFTGKVTEDFDRAMAQFKAEGKSRLILDLRDNGGGRIDYLASVAAHLVNGEQGKKVPLMKISYKKSSEVFDTEKIVYHSYGFTAIKVLVNGNTASASEALVGAMLDYGSITLADVYGTTSYGKGIMQTTYPHYGYGDAIKLTTAKILWPVSETCIHGVGVVPGVVKEDGLGTTVYSFEKDGVLMAAFASILG